MEMNKEWRKTRRVAHWILRQLHKESIAILGYLKEQTNEFTMPEICEAARLLLLNGDIEITDQSAGKGIEYSFIHATHSGMISYHENKYEIQGRKEINFRKSTSWIAGLLRQIFKSKRSIITDIS